MWSFSFPLKLHAAKAAQLQCFSLFKHVSVLFLSSVSTFFIGLSYLKLNVVLSLTMRVNKA